MFNAGRCDLPPPKVIPTEVSRDRRRYLHWVSKPGSEHCRDILLAQLQIRFQSDIL